LSDLAHFLPTSAGNEHLHQAFGNLWLITTVWLKGLRVERCGAVSGDSEVFDRARACHQVTRVEPMARASALRRTFPPFCSQKLAQFFAHAFFHHRSPGLANLGPQILMKALWPQWLSFGDT
jgi:hypothetical protein